MSGFYDDNDKEQDDSIKKTVIGAICMASIVFLVFLICMYQGTKPKKIVTNQSNSGTDEEYYDNSDSEVEVGQSNLKSDDLDFWDMFGSKKTVDYADTESEKDNSEGTPAVFTEQGVKPDIIENNSSDKDEAKWVNGDPNDGTHIGIEDSDGNKIWYEILDIAKSSYSPNNVKKTDSGMIQYVDGNMKSALGKYISSQNGNMDMASEKNNGITYVMLRSHLRNSQSGLIEIDTLFNQNAVNAAKNGLYIGMAVDSDAMTDAEAVEEANYAIATASTVKPQYPIAINIPNLSDNDSRMSKLSNKQRTDVIKAFCDQVRSFGYKPVIHASKSDLISKINIEDLSAYDIWVTDVSDTGESDITFFTDYPYVFTMWQYSLDTGYSTSFVNYEQN